MSTEELPADLGRLKITPTLPGVNLAEGDGNTPAPISLNPFYSTNTKSDIVCQSIYSTKYESMHRRRNRFRRRSESCLDECKHADTSAPDPIDFATSLRFPPGVQKVSLKKSNGVTVKKSILRCLHDQRTNGEEGRWIISNPEDSSDASTSTQKLSSNIKSNTNGIGNLRDLISECNILLKSKSSVTTKNRALNIAQSSSSYAEMQPKDINYRSGHSKDHRHIKKCEQNYRDSTGNRMLVHSSTCSQQASNSSASSTNCDDVTIDELASYFDTMVHIPKKMSSMAEMMYT